MSELTFTDTIDIAALPANVWALTMDVASLPSVTPTVRVATRLDDGPLAVGSRVRLRQQGLPAAVWTVDELVEPTRFAWSTRVLGVQTLAVHQLEPHDGGTRQTLTVTLSGRAAGVVAAMSGTRITHALASENAGFRERAEGR